MSWDDIRETACNFVNTMYQGGDLDLKIKTYDIGSLIFELGIQYQFNEEDQMWGTSVCLIHKRMDYIRSILSCYGTNSIQNLADCIAEVCFDIDYQKGGR